jgi:hypothetical protein
VWIVIVLASVPLFGYGWLNVVTPRTTRAWQVRSTARYSEGDPRAVVGRSVQRLLGDDPTTSPDRRVLRRMRIVGIVEIALSLAIAGVAVAAKS